MSKVSTWDRGMCNNITISFILPSCIISVWLFNTGFAPVCFFPLAVNQTVAQICSSDLGSDYVVACLSVKL